MSDELIDFEEGCVSIPKYLCIVSRPKFITCEYYNLKVYKIKILF